MTACGLAREIGSIGIVFANHRSREKAREGGRWGPDASGNAAIRLK